MTPVLLLLTKTIIHRKKYLNEKNINIGKIKTLNNDKFINEEVYCFLGNQYIYINNFFNTKTIKFEVLKSPRLK